MLNLKKVGASVVGAVAIGLTVGSVAPSEAATIGINTTYNLSQGFSSTANLDGGPVAIQNGDNVALTVNFLNNKALTIGDNSEFFSGWLQGNSGSFTINNAKIDFLGASTVGGAQTSYLLGTQQGGFVHLGPYMSNFLSSGQSISFTGYRVTYDVASIQNSPVQYSKLWFNAGGNLSVSDVTPIPTPALLPSLIGMGIAILRKREQKADEQSKMTEL